MSGIRGRRPVKFGLAGWAWTIGGIVLTRTAPLMRRRPVDTGSRGFIVTPAEPGSLGDEAFLIATIQQIASRGYRVTLLVRGDAMWWRERYAVEVLEMRRHLHAVPSREFWDFARGCRPDDVLVYPGVDVASGAYGSDAIAQLLLVHAAAAAGTKAVIISLSWPGRAKALASATVRMLPQTVEIIARDSVSHERLAVDIRRPITLGADVAFLLDSALAPRTPDPAMARALTVLAERRRAGSIVLGVNLSSLTVDVSPFDESPGAGARVMQLVDVASRAIADWLAAGDRMVVLIPHDERGAWSDRWLAEAVLAALPAPVKDRCRISPAASAVAIRAVCDAVDAVVASRMHLVIACVERGTAVAALGYGGKFAGLFSELGLSALLGDEATATSMAALRRLFDDVTSARAGIRAVLAERADTLVVAARRNFVGVPYASPEPACVGPESGKTRGRARPDDRR